RGATAHAEVGAVVQLVLTGHRVLAHAVRGGDRPVHREHEAVVGGRSPAAITAATAATAATATGVARGLLLLALTRLPLLGGPLLRGALGGCSGAPLLRLDALLDAALHRGSVGLQFGVALLLGGDLVRGGLLRLLTGSHHRRDPGGLLA